jgi:phosphoenolpyruvate synthase/pyruvate phosphate dikinase
MIEAGLVTVSRLMADRTAPVTSTVLKHSAGAGNAPRCCQAGGATSHAAVVSRELGRPSCGGL